MRTLETDFKRGGYEFKQLFREGNVAIYGQKRPEWRDYFRQEVVIIRERDAREVFGKVFEASEVYPASEEWGRLGWTCGDLRAAQAKAGALIVVQNGKEGGSMKTGGLE